jgi:hypothetical protein
MPIRCGYTRKSPLDTFRLRYARAERCQFVVATVLMGCFDPLPVINGSLPNNSCRVAFVDNMTLAALEQHPPSSQVLQDWEFVIIPDAAMKVFRHERKFVKALRHSVIRLFPLAERGVWLDGQSIVKDLNEFTSQNFFGVLTALRHVAATPSYTVVDEVARVLQKKPYLNKTTLYTQLDRYTQEGFVERSQRNAFGWLDASTTTFSQDPCVVRFRCGWHNEVNYYAHRDQISLLYTAERLRLLSYVGYEHWQHFRSQRKHTHICGTSANELPSAEPTATPTQFEETKAHTEVLLPNFNSTSASAGEPSVATTK